MERDDNRHDGVMIVHEVPVVDGAEHRAFAYLHLTGTSRDLSSVEISVFGLVPGEPEVTAHSGPEHPGFLGRTSLYNSPPTPGQPPAGAPPAAAEQGSADMLVDVSDGIRRLAPGGRIDLAIAMTSVTGRPLPDTSSFQVDDLRITRRSA